ILIHNGAGSAILLGQGGDDYLEVSPDSTGYVVLDGGSGDDFLLNNSRIQGNVAAGQAAMSCTQQGAPGTGVPTNQMCGGSGNDTLVGSSAGTSYLDGGAGTDSITVNGANDVVYAGSGDDIVQMTLPSVSIATTRIHGGGDTNDILTLTGTNGPDALTLSSISNGMQIVSSGKTLQVDGFHELDLVLNGGADSVTVNDLEGSSVKTLSIDVGQNVTTVGTRLVTDPDSGYQMQQPVIVATPDRTADVVTLNGGSRDDSFTLSGNDPTTGIGIVHIAKTGSATFENVQL